MFWCNSFIHFYATGKNHNIFLGRFLFGCFAIALDFNSLLFFSFLFHTLRFVASNSLEIISSTRNFYIFLVTRWLSEFQTSFLLTCPVTCAVMTKLSDGNEKFPSLKAFLSLCKWQTTLCSIKQKKNFYCLLFAREDGA